MGGVAQNAEDGGWADKTGVQTEWGRRGWGTGWGRGWHSYIEAERMGDSRRTTPGRKEEEQRKANSSLGGSHAATKKSHGTIRGHTQIAHLAAIPVAAHVDLTMVSQEPDEGARERAMVEGRRDGGRGEGGHGSWEAKPAARLTGNAAVIENKQRSHRRTESAATWLDGIPHKTSTRLTNQKREGRSSTGYDDGQTEYLTSCKYEKVEALNENTPGT